MCETDSGVFERFRKRGRPFEVVWDAIQNYIGVFLGEKLFNEGGELAAFAEVRLGITRVII